MKYQNTLARPWMVAVLSTLFGGMTALASPQLDLDNPNDETLQEEPATLVQRQLRPTRQVDKRLVGWQQAGLGTEENRIDNQLRANWIVLNKSEGINGRLIGVEEPVTVHLLRGGFLVGKATSDSNGNFEFETASPGPYTIVGHAREAVFAYSFNAVERNGQGISMPIEIETLPVAGRDNNKLITRLVKQYSPSVEFDVYGEYDVGQAADDPPQYYGWSGLKNFDENAIPATSIRNHRVGILSDGRFVGRIHQIHNRNGRPVEVRNTDIKIMQNGELVAETQVDVLGVFEVTGLAPGSYGLVAIGSDGFAALGLELIERSDVPVAPQSEARFGYDPLFRNISSGGYYQEEGDDAMMDAMAETEMAEPEIAEPVVFDACLCDPESMGWINNYVQEQEHIYALTEPRPELVNQMPYDYFSYNNGFGGCGDGGGGYGGGGGCGGGGGGGGGFGFGGGGGGLLIGAAVAIAIADAIDDDNGGVIILPGPVSPFFP